MKSLSLSDGVAGAEGARRATGDPATGADGSVPDPAVSEKARRRRFTTEYKLHILREVDQCKAPGEVGAILRREGLHSSNLTTSRRQIDQVAREGLAKKKRGPKAKPEDPRVKQLERENARLKRRLQRAEAMLEIQKKPPSSWGSGGRCKNNRNPLAMANAVKISRSRKKESYGA